jgi:hypothetical protein
MGKTKLTIFDSRLLLDEMIDETKSGNAGVREFLINHQQLAIVNRP